MGRIQSSWAQEGIVLALRAFPWFALLHVVGRLLPLALPHAGAAAAAAGWWPLLRFYWAIEAVLFVEAAFLVYVQYRARVLDRTDRAPPQLSPAELELMFERLLRHTEDMKAMISGWFLDAPFEELRKEDLEMFVAWMLLQKDAEAVQPGEERRVVDRAMAAIEAAAGHALAPRQLGEEPKRVMRHTLDPIKYKHRPLLVYLATHGLINEALGYFLLRVLLGFRRHRADHIIYWHRPGAPSAAAVAATQQPPLVFVHGIGLGLAMYYHFLTLLPRRRGDIFLVELPHASLKLCEFVPSAPMAVASLRRMLAAHGHARAVFAAHSLGTVYVSWMCRYASDAVAASVFVEPICFMLFLRTLTHNFLYQEYGGAIGYVIRSEFFLNHALRRHFWWQLKVLFVEDIHHPSLIYLTEQDEVVPTQEVKRYVREHDTAGHVTVAMIDHQFHGSWILDAAVCERVVAGIERLWAAVAAGAAVGPRATGDEEQEGPQLLERRGRGRRLMSRPFPRLRKGLALLLRRRRAGGRTESVMIGKGGSAPGPEAAAAAVGAY